MYTFRVALEWYEVHNTACEFVASDGIRRICPIC